jgi:prevent-host-death family protein
VITTVDIHEAKTHLSELVDRAAAGEDIVIARAGRPVARLTTLTRPAEPRQFGQLRGRITIADDFDETPDWVVETLES